MGAAFSLQEQNIHQVTVGTTPLLFHIPSSALFESDAVSHAIIGALRAEDGLSAAQLQQRLHKDACADSIDSALLELQQLGIVSDGGAAAVQNFEGLTTIPLATVVLNINTGCNLSCTYCYKEDLETPADGSKMSFDTARDAIEMLVRQSPDEPRYNIVFFGGEPLSNLALIRDVTEYAEKRAVELGKHFDFSLTTNATLLNEKTISWLDQHRFGIAVSIDGPKTIHDQNRLTVGGKGTYETVAAKVRILLAQYRSRPVGARVTLTRGTTDVWTIWNHLFHELGFAEVGFAPVTAGDDASFNLSDDELVEVFAAMKRLGEHYVNEALENRNIGFSNLHQLLTDIHQGSKKALPCGAGYSMLAVDDSGGLNLCHRFTGSSLPQFGSVSDGPDIDSLSNFLSQRLDRSGTGCDTCRIRNLCSGGCYHESYQRYNDPAHPVYHYCDLMRDWVDFGIEAYARIMTGNPNFFTQYLVPRRPDK